MNKGRKLYFYLSQSNESKLFSSRQMAIVSDLNNITDEKLEWVINHKWIGTCEHCGYEFEEHPHQFCKEFELYKLENKK
ncbi:MAG: hypothetical protein R3321_02345 [Nitrososphaeraceae archaeon]|nr:hypothetical protein [Nitrososphaeraceae archaeon]